MVLLRASKQPLIERKCPLFDEVQLVRFFEKKIESSSLDREKDQKTTSCFFKKKNGHILYALKGPLGWKDENPLNQKQPTQSSPNPGVLLP